MTSVIVARVYTDYATAMNSDTYVFVIMASLEQTVMVWQHKQLIPQFDNETSKQKNQDTKNVDVLCSQTAWTDALAARVYTDHATAVDSDTHVSVRTASQEQTVMVLRN